MKEADKRGRIVVAYNGLEKLLFLLRDDPTYKSTRSGLFAVPRGQEKVPEYHKALRTKDWQRDYVARLVEAELLEKATKDGQDFYYPSDPGAIQRIITDHDNHGLKLSKFLFPREAGIPDELLGDEVEDEPVKEDSAATKELQAEKSQVTVTLDPEVLEKCLGLLNHMARERNATRDVLETVASTYAGVETAINKLTEEKQIDRDFPNYMKNRVKELTEKITLLEKKLTDNDNHILVANRTLARIEADQKSLMPGFADGFGMILTALGVAKGSNLVQHIEASIKKHVGRSSNANLARDVFAQLRAKLQDLEAIDDLAMKAVESMEKDDVG
jgi:hypothetical protein